MTLTKASRIKRSAWEGAMSEYDAKTKLGAFGEHFQAFKAFAKVLLGGHGLGLAGSIAVLKEKSPELNVGVFIWLFGVGLLLAGLYFFMLTITEVEVRQRIINQGMGKSGWRGRIMQVATHISMWGSIAAFVWAIALGIYRFG
jgi:hypothetical protein